LRPKIASSEIGSQGEAVQLSVAFGSAGLPETIMQGKVPTTADFAEIPGNNPLTVPKSQSIFVEKKMSADWMASAFSQATVG